MDIRTWQDAGRGAADPYHPRHRGGRSPFRPWRPGPVAIGSLSTAAVAAVAFAAPGVIHVRTVPVDTRLDGAPNHVGPLTPGPGGQAADAGQSAQLVAPGTATPPPPQPGTTGQTSSGGTAPGSDTGGGVTGGDGTSGGGSIRSATSHNDGTQGPTGQQSGHHQAGTAGGSASPNSGHNAGTTNSGKTDPGNGGSSGTKPGKGPGSPTKPGGGSGNPTNPTDPAPPGDGGWWGGGWGDPSGGNGGSTNPNGRFDSAAAVSSAVTAIDAARASHHTGRLRVDAALTLAATVHTADMAFNGTFSHMGTDGSDPYIRALRAGAMTFTKEIIARGNPGDDVIKALLQDPSSYAALTSSGSHAIGIAAQQDPDTGQIVWTIELGWA